MVHVPNDVKIRSLEDWRLTLEVTSVFTGGGGNKINERVACGDWRRETIKKDWRKMCCDGSLEFVDLYTVSRAYWFNISSNNFNNPGKCNI